jgi:hypothetical protein
MVDGFKKAGHSAYHLHRGQKLFMMFGLMVKIIFWRKGINNADASSFYVKQNRVRSAKSVM